MFSMCIDAPKESLDYYKKSCVSFIIFYFLSLPYVKNNFAVITVSSVNNLILSILVSSLEPENKATFETRLIRDFV